MWIHFPTYQKIINTDQVKSFEMSSNAVISPSTDLPYHLYFLNAIHLDGTSVVIDTLEFDEINRVLSELHIMLEGGV